MFSKGPVIPNNIEVWQVVACIGPGCETFSIHHFIKFCHGQFKAFYRLLYLKAPNTI